MKRTVHADLAVDDVLLRDIADCGTEEVEGRIEIGAVIEHLPARSGPASVEGVEQGRFAGAAGPEDRYELARLEHQGMSSLGRRDGCLRLILTNDSAGGHTHGSCSNIPSYSAAQHELRDYELHDASGGIGPVAHQIQG